MHNSINEDYLERLEFEVVSASDLAKRVDGATIDLICPSVHIPIANISFGQINEPRHRVLEYPPGGWDTSVMKWDNLYNFTFNNVTVYSEEGFLIVDNKYIIEECLRLCYFHEDRVKWVGHGRVSLPLTKPRVFMEHGQNFMSGYPGNRNYAHWLVDIMAGCYSPFVNEAATKIFPITRFPYQNEYMRVLDLDSNSVFLDESGAVHCQKLTLNSSSLVDPGHFPHPARLALISKLKGISRFNGGARRKIFISRKDSQSRIFKQEDQVIEYLRGKGFEIHTLTEKSVLEQIKLFSEASIVIGAHGAGMANVIFCPANAIFLELFYSSYVQWSMRRLASLVPLRYGCVIGEEIGPEAGPYATEWAIDMLHLKDAVESALLTIDT